MNVLTRSRTTLNPASLADSELLQYDRPWPIECWIQYADRSRELLESYQLLEIQLFKNLYNVEHEFLIAKFMSPEEIIFISVERTARFSHLDHAATHDDIIQAMIKAKIDNGRNEESSIRTGSRRSSASLVNASIAYDMVMVIRGPTTFEDAAGRFMGRQMRRHFSRATYVHRGTMKFGRTSESNIASPSSTTDNSPTGPVPNLAHFSYVMVAAHRTRPCYTPTGQNCYWFANAILFILRKIFNPEPFVAHSTVGTWSFGPVKVSLGSLQGKDCQDLINEYNKCVSIMISVVRSIFFEFLNMISYYIFDLYIWGTGWGNEDEDARGDGGGTAATGVHTDASQCGGRG
jgi:hypothetical protein